MARVTNFATTRTTNAGGIIAVVWAVAVAFAIGCAVMTFQGLTLLDREQTLTGHIADLKAELAALEATETTAPSAAEYAALSARVTYHNTLLGERRAELMDILGALETALPADVWLRDLSYDTPTGRLSLSLLSRDETAPPAALQSIEAIDLLQDVILKRQVQMRQGQEELVQYEVGGVAR
mgnify:CR=1 FL=1